MGWATLKKHITAARVHASFLREALVEIVLRSGIDLDSSLDEMSNQQLAQAIESSRTSAADFGSPVLSEYNPQFFSQSLSATWSHPAKSKAACQQNNFNFLNQFRNRFSKNY